MVTPTTPSENTTATATMRAVEYDRYGGPEVLRIRRVPVPAPGSRQVLVRVHAASVNPADIKIRAGNLKPLSRWRFPKRTGLDFAGEVTALGGEVTDILVGQRVWGFVSDPTGRVGSLADYLAVDADIVSPVPAGLTLTDAAALPSVGVAALCALRDRLRVRPGHRVLIVGASGGVGSTATQLATAMGARVTAVASTANHDLCRALGATATVDYSDPAPLRGPFDSVLDCHGTRLGVYRRLLVSHGRMLSLVPTALGAAAVSLFTPGPRIRLMAARPRRADLAALAGYIDTGALRPVVAATYPLDDIRTAHRDLHTGHARGKTVIVLHPAGHSEG
ncbi:NAD(P)-dependent alcohol dehydrogenase [Nocardia sp. NPDC003482]